jgi:anhydro-N-acetylmuramic acid kinase
VAERKVRTALGLMSGTSMDGIDAAILVTDGERIVRAGRAVTVPYDDGFRERLRDAVLNHRSENGVARDLTLHHAQAVKALLRDAGLSASDIDVIGFHGHTVLHDPQHARTVQIGDGALLAHEIGVPVVCDFRAADVTAGGQGAPLVPIYHRALALALEDSAAVCILNIGGVANVTWIAPASDGQSGDGLLAFDTGPGIALIDDWVRRTVGGKWDEGGQLAASGKVDAARLARLMDHAFFEQKPPKSLDRNTFKADFFLGDIVAADGAATLARFTAECVARGRAFFPAQPKRWIACGGGRRNAYLMATLSTVLGERVAPADDMGWDGDALEAQAFAYLAVRHLMNWPISFPSTTGAPHPIAGGRLFEP